MIISSILILFSGIIFTKYLLNKVKINIFEFLLISVVTGLLLNSFFILILHLMNLYSVISLFILFLVFIVSLILLLYFNEDNNISLANNSTTKLYEVVFLFIITGIFIWINSIPSEWIMNFGMDASNYLVQASYYGDHTGIFLEQTQTVLYQDTFPNAQYKGNSANSFPLINETMRETSFPPLWKMTLSFFIIFGSLEISLYIPLLVSVLLILILYVLIKKLYSRQVAFIITIFFATSPLIVQYSKITLSEPLMLLVILFSMYLYTLANQFNDKKIAFIAAFILSLIFLVRADAVILYAGLSAFLLIKTLIDKKSGQEFHIFSSTFFIISFLFWLVSLYASPLYMEHLKYTSFLTFLMFALIPIYYFLYRFNNPKIISHIENILQRYNIYFVISIILIFLFYFLIRSSMTSEFFNETSLKLLGKVFGSEVIAVYISHVFFITGLVGLYIIYKNKEKQSYALVFLFLIIAIIFTYNISHSNTLYWSSRRYYYSLLPLLIISNASFFNYLVVKKKFVSLIFVFLLISINYMWIYKNHIEITRSHHVGDLQKLRAFSAQFTESDIVIIDGNIHNSDAYQQGLKYYYQIEALSPKFNTISDVELIKFYGRSIKNNKRIHFIISDNLHSRIKNIFVLQEKDALGFDLNSYQIVGRRK